MGSVVRHLLQDRVLQMGLAIYGLMLVLMVGSKVDAGTPGTLLSFVDPVLLGLTLAGLLWGRSLLPGRGERRFWDLLALSWVCWLAVEFFYFFEPELPLLSTSFAADVLYLLFYLAFALAIDQRPHIRRERSLRTLRRSLESAAGLTAVFGLLVYFALVVLPEPLGLSLSFVSRDRGFTPLLLVRLTLDLLLLARLIHATLTSQGRWSRLYGLLAGAMLLYAVRDGLVVLQYEEVVTLQGWPWDLFVYLPGLAMLVAIRFRHLPLAEKPVSEVEALSEEGRVIVRSGPLTLYTLALPIVHFLFYPLGLLDPATQTAREVFCLLYVAVMGAVTWAHQGLLEKDRRRALDSLRDAEERLLRSQRLESIGRLAGGIAHDFNNYLTVIQCWSELLREGITDPETRAQIGHIENAAGRAAHLTAQLLAIGRRQVLRPEALDLNAVILDTSEMLRSLLGEDVDLRVDLDPTAGLARADHGQTEQILVNLAVNSRHAMVGGGTLTLRTVRTVLTPGEAERLDISPGSYVMLSVSDTGCGMSEEVLQKAFEPFFTTRDRGRGTGLGLSTVYGIVAQSGGAITVESSPGRGTQVRILLPSAPPPTDEIEVEPAAESTADEARARVLVVEDKDEVRRLAVRILERSGFEVLEASGGLAALQVIADETRSIDLVVTDVVMPGMDGVELAHELLNRDPEQRILFVSGYPAEIRRERQLVLPPSIPLVQKPFTASGLITSVREVLARPPGADAPTDPPLETHGA